MAAELAVARAGAILAVADVERSIAFYSDTLGFQVEATYATTTRPTPPSRGRACVCRWRSRATRPRIVRRSRTVSQKKETEPGDRLNSAF